VSPADEVEDDGTDSFLPPFANAENKALDGDIRVCSTNPPRANICFQSLNPKP